MSEFQLRLFVSLGRTMTTNWSLILNILLLVGVVLILVRTVKKKREVILPMDDRKPNLSLDEKRTDDIIAIRKIDNAADASSLETTLDNADELEQQDSTPELASSHQEPVAQTNQKAPPPMTDKTLMLFLLAKPHRNLAGYEMLQSILAAGLRFGEGQLFHRHQFPNGQGPIICSLAAANAAGTFDLQNIGAFNAKGLCLYMHLSGSPTFDTDRLEKMLETAYHLAEGLDTYLLDDARKPLTSETKARYRRLLDSATINNEA